MPYTKDLVRAGNQALRTYDSSGGDSSFQAVGNPLLYPGRLIKFKNDSDQDISISYDGVTTHDIILAGDREVEDLCTNKTIDSGLMRGAGIQIYASSAAGTGNLYITVIHAEK